MRVCRQPPWNRCEGPEVLVDSIARARVIIKPNPIGDLSHVSASVETVRGIVSSRWRIEGGALYIDIALPVNSRGTVYLPILGVDNPVIDEGESLIWKNEAFVKGIPGVYSGEQVGGSVELHIGSGEYSFKLHGRHT